MNRLRLVFVLAGVAAVAGCRPEELAGPPDIKLGRDECVECGMIISEEKYACGMLVAADSRREYRLFDDVGCMLDHEHEHKTLTVIDRYVRDDATRAWVTGASAAFLFTDGAIRTPMGSGIGCYADLAGAEAGQKSLGGQVLDYPALAAARREWMWKRYGRPASGEQAGTGR